MRRIARDAKMTARPGQEAALVESLLDLDSGSLQVALSAMIARTTFPVFCPVSTYCVASTTCSSG
jgi:hypothetical protein